MTAAFMRYVPATVQITHFSVANKLPANVIANQNEK